MNSSPTSATPFCVGEWLDSDESTFRTWVDQLSKKSEARGAELHPVMQRFRDAVMQDSVLLGLASQMFEQVPLSPPFDRDPSGNPQLRSFGQFVYMLNSVLTTPPAYTATGIAGVPINAMLAWAMATPSGYAVFLHPKVNHHLRLILNEWGRFLRTPASLPALDENPRTGWFGADAMAKMPNFDMDFECDPNQRYRGFKSWDDFFTRRFRAGRRPVSAPDDHGTIVNACEAAPFRLTLNVQLLDRFWIKGQPYSLQHMLDRDELASRFEGGTVYQAFLSSFSYHRWHSPICGHVVKARVVEGTYYAQNQMEGFDAQGPRRSQAFITQVATRALIFIQAEHSGIGLVCFIAVGMAEVSTCDITVSVGDYLHKGDQLGMFHFGGSTHCLVFGPQAQLQFDLHGNTPGLDAVNIPVNQRIASVMPSGVVQKKLAPAE